MANIAPTQHPQQQFETTRSEKFISVYSNNTILDTTPWDFKFAFGVWVKPEPGKLPQVENLVEVVMSPQHAKALLGVLTTHIQNYETHVGEIKLPQAVEPSAETKH
ncbi:MAG: DUF3467 domain-containing protein [Candidatus Korobacteraceae bacterium]